MRRRHRLVPVVLGLLLAGFAFAWVERRATRTEPVEPMEGLETEPAREPRLSPALAPAPEPTAPRPEPTGGRTPPVAPGSLPPETTARRVAVRDAAGRPIRDAAVTLFGGGRTFTLELEPDGTVLVPPEAERAGVERLSLRVERAGGPAVVARAPAFAQRDVVVSVPHGREFQGRVLERDRPAGVPDLPIVVSSSAVRAYAVLPEDVDDAAWAGAHVGAAEPPARVRARTDADGHFHVRVASDTVSVVADPSSPRDRAWFLLQPEAPLPAARPATLLAVPAATVEGSVTDAGTGTPLPASDVTVRLGRHERGAALSFRVHALDGSFRATCARVAPAGSPLPGSVSAEAGGFVPLEVPFELPASEWTARADLRLRSLASAGGDVTAEVEIRDEDGDPSDLPWFLEVAAPTRERRRLGTAALRRTAPGRYTASVPAGEWSLRIVLPQPFDDLYGASEVVHVEAEHPPSLRLRVPRGGAVVLTSAALEEGPSRDLLTIETPREGTPWWRAESVPRASEVRFHALPEAPREMRLSLGRDRVGAAAVVRPAKGRETRVDVPAP